MKLALLLLIAIGLFVQPGKAQQPSDTLNNLLFEQSSLPYHYQLPERRKLLSLKHKPNSAKLNPFNYIAAGLLFFYQRVLSEQIQAHCMYEISCSNYTKLAIQQYGFKGFLLGINQLNNCFPTAEDDYPRFMLSKDLKIINTIEQ